MANLISNLLAQASPMGRMLQQASGMAQAVQSGTPMGMLSQNDPRMKQVYDYINSCGGDPKKAFYMLAKQKGVDPEVILNQARAMRKG